jgi:hypothetical protein
MLFGQSRQYVVDGTRVGAVEIAIGLYGAAVPEADAHPDVIADRYRLLRPLGQGGMGRVWAARDGLLDRDVALKELVLPPGLTPAEIHELRERAIREARAIARIDHPSVVRIFDVVRSGGAPWIVMELVPSRTLFQVVREDGPMAPERAAEIGLGVLGALRAAHRAGVLHRDVKPANVLLGHGGRVVLTDFGLAVTAGDSSMTSTGVVLGSPSYLAPERALDHHIGPAADLWSLGATLYAAVEGRPPYDKSSPVATLAALATEPPAPPVRAGVLRPALDGLLRKDPARRVEAAEAERLLRAAAAGQMAPPEVARAEAAPAEMAVQPSGEAAQVQPSGAATGEMPAAPSRRRRWWIGVAAVAAVAVAAAVARPMLSSADAEALFPLPQVQPSDPSAASTPSPAAASQDAAPPPSRSAVAPVGPAEVTRTAQQTATATATTRTPAPGTSPATTAAATGHQIENMKTGTCLTLVDDAVQLWACDGTDRQKFSFPSDGTMRVLGECIRILGTDNGARLGTGACSGSPAQWNYNTSYDLVNLKVVKCTDVPDGDSTNGVPAQVWECTGNGNQKWRY